MPSLVRKQSASASLIVLQRTEQAAFQDLLLLSIPPPSRSISNWRALKAISVTNAIRSLIIIIAILMMVVMMMMMMTSLMKMMMRRCQQDPISVTAAAHRLSSKPPLFGEIRPWPPSDCLFVCWYFCLLFDCFSCSPRSDRDFPLIVCLFVGIFLCCLIVFFLFGEIRPWRTSDGLFVCWLLCLPLCFTALHGFELSRCCPLWFVSPLVCLMSVINQASYFRLCSNYLFLCL